jgi:hypothetical protein
MKALPGDIYDACAHHDDSCNGAGAARSVQLQMTG